MIPEIVLCLFSLQVLPCFCNAYVHHNSSYEYVYCFKMDNPSDHLKLPNIFLSHKTDIVQLKNDVIFPYGHENSAVFDCVTGGPKLPYYPDYKNLTTIEYRFLDLEKIYVDGSGISALFQSVTLQDLWITAVHKQFYHGEQFWHIHVKKLEKLHLNGMNSSDIEYILNITKSIKGGSLLRVLDIRQPLLQRRYLPKIFFSFPHLRTFVLKELSIMWQNHQYFYLDLQLLAHLNDTLEYFDFSENQIVVLFNYNVLHSFKRLRILDLAGTEIIYNYHNIPFITKRLTALEIFFNIQRVQDVAVTNNGRQMKGYENVSQAFCICNSTSNSSLQELYISVRDSVFFTFYANKCTTGAPYICLPQAKSLYKLHIDRQALPAFSRMIAFPCFGHPVYINLDNLHEINLANFLGPHQTHLPIESYIACITTHAENVLRFTTGGLHVRLMTSLCHTLKNVKHLNLSSSNITEIPAVTFETCSQTTILDLSFNHIHFLHDNLFHGMRLLQRLSLNTNHLLVLNLYFPQSIDFVDVSSNYIEYITEASRASIERVSLHNDISLDLSNNSLSYGCNMDHLDTIRWIKAINGTVMNKHGLTCSGIRGKQYMYDVDVTLTEQVCFPSHLVLIVTTTCSNLTLVLLIVSIVLCYKYRFRVQTNFLKLQRRIKCEKKFKHSNLYIKYDAFISYCAEDRFWVHRELMDVLETRHGFQLCIHYRDFPAGGDLAEAIIDHMLHSDIIAVVLSHKFIQKPWCEYELQQANAFAVNYGKHLIIIKKGDIPSRRRTGLIGSILDSRIYITWPEKTDDISPEKYEDKKELFWQKVVNEMYHSKDGCIALCCKSRVKSSAVELVEIDQGQHTDDDNVEMEQQSADDNFSHELVRLI